MRYGLRLSRRHPVVSTPSPFGSLSCTAFGVSRKMPPVNGEQLPCMYACLEGLEHDCGGVGDWIRRGVKGKWETRMQHRLLKSAKP